MSILNEMLGKLTDVFTKKPSSNIGKLLSVAASQIDEIRDTLTTIDDWKDIDQAKGKGLDRIGEDIVREYRGDLTDEEYRMRIKTKIQANLSKGDIETINEITRVFLGDALIGTRELWSIEDDIFDKEPAAVLISTEEHTPFPVGVIGRVVAGGVNIYWHVVFKTSHISITVQKASGKSTPFPYAGQLYSGDVRKPNTYGVVFAKDLSLLTEANQGELIYRKASPELRNYSDGVRFDEPLTVLSEAIEGDSIFPRCGTFASGEEV